MQSRLQAETRFRPRRFAQRRAVVSAPAADGIKFGADKHRRLSRGNTCDARFTEQRGDSCPFAGGGATAGEMVKQRQRVRLASTELRGEIENGIRLSALAGQAADDFGGERSEVFRQIRPLQKPFRFLVIGGRAAFADLVEVDGEFGCVERFAFTQVLARGDDFVPGSEWHISEGA